MRPLQLTMSAFGPYAQEIALDFGQLGNQNIFVITGPTGAGKTTIFDGICYALYGKTSGAERTTKGLRSDFVTLEEKIITQVTFTFMVRGKTYGVKRQPEQRLPNKRGDGWKSGSLEMELYCIDHDEFAPLTKQSEVDHKIIEILGLNLDQFKKIVMIPQGDFRQFLSANTTVKQAILRKLFGTDFFEQVQKALSDQAKTLEQQNKEAERLVRENLKRVDCAQDEALLEAIGGEKNLGDILPLLDNLLIVDQKRREACQLAAERLEKEQQICQRQLTAGQVLNGELAKFDKAKAQNQRLLAQGPLYEQKKQNLSWASKARQIEPLAEQYQRLMANEASQRANLQTLENRYLGKKAEKEAILLEVSQIKAQAQTKEQQQKQLTQLEGYEADVSQLATAQAHENKLRGKGLAHGQQLEKLKIDHAEAKAQEQDLLTKLKTMDQHRLHKEQVKQKIQSEEEEQGALRKIHTNLNQYSKAWAQCQAQLTLTGAAEKSFYQAEALLQAKRSLQLANYSSHLANQLVEGAPCPVCGATDHPLPHRDEALKAVSPEDIQSLEEALQEKQQDWQGNLTKQNQWQGQIKALKEVLEPEMTAHQDLSPEGLTAWLETVLNRDNILAKSITQGEQDAKKDEEALAQEVGYQGQLTKTIALLTQYAQQGELDQGEAITLAQEEARVTAEVQGILDRVPVAYQKIKDLQKAQDSLKEALTKYKAQSEAVQGKFDQVNGELGSLEGQVQMTKELLKDTQAQFAEAQAVWNQTVTAQFETQEDYRAGRRLIGQIDQLNGIIQDYQGQLAGSQQLLGQYEFQLQGQSLVDVVALGEALSVLAAEAKEMVMLEQQILHRLRNNGAISQALYQQVVEIAGLAKEYGLTKALDKLANGDNDWRMSFETFVLVTYFTQVLAGANARLQKMTGGRYFFLRRMEAGDKRKMAGLEIDIMDNYTGKAREVSSLSGGESFKASLALALGLSDVVQNSAGGIELNTIFIDEGFGTLDPDSLDATLDCLVELQEHGRLVGVISHVAELRERIPAWLVVEPSEKGSRAYFKKN